MKLHHVLMVGLVTVLVACSPTGSPELDSFATCITENGAKMFGAYWCPHCKDQKADFGESWDKVNYIECSLPGGRGQTEVCAQAGIQGYPTWEFGDGERVSGRQSFEALAQKTGCSLP